MANVKIKGNPDGLGSVIIEAPNTDSDITMTLPDNAGQVLTDQNNLNADKLTSGTLPAARIADGSLDGAKITAGSLTEDRISGSISAAKLDVSGNGTAGQALTSAGDGSFAWADAGGGLRQVRKSQFMSSGTWTAYPNTTHLLVQVGGGGGGGGFPNNANVQWYTAAGGGGGGGGAVSWMTIEQAGNTQSITVGAGGTNNGNNSRGNGNAGGTSSFGNLLSANGGNGAGTNYHYSAPSTGNGGSGSVNVGLITGTANGGNGSRTWFHNGYTIGTAGTGNVGSGGGGPGIAKLENCGETCGYAQQYASGTSGADANTPGNGLGESGYGGNGGYQNGAQGRVVVTEFHSADDNG